MVRPSCMIGLTEEAVNLDIETKGVIASTRRWEMRLWDSAGALQS